MRAPVRGHRERQRRVLHPAAWWLWAIGLAVAASKTTNPLLLAVLLAVVGYVVTARRADAPWARGFKYYLLMALIVIVIRVVLRSVFGGDIGPTDHILFRLPQVPLPQWAQGVQLGGAVSLQATLAACTDGLRLGCLLCCIGAANALANPKRALRVLPGALYELGVAVVVAISVAPQLVESVQRVRQARRLRGGSGHGRQVLRSIAIPVFEDALERSLRLAAAMDSRGYGRTGSATRGARRGTAALLLSGLVALCLGVYGLLDASGPTTYLGLPAIALGAALCCAGLALGGRRVSRTSYRPDPWRAAEWIVALSGWAAAIVMFTGVISSSALDPGYYPLHWPPLPIVATLAILVAGLAGVVAPPPPGSDPAHPVDADRPGAQPSADVPAAPDRVEVHA